MILQRVKRYKRMFHATGNKFRLVTKERFNCTGNINLATKSRAQKKIQAPH